MYEYVTPEKVLALLEWLKQHNPFYADIEINEDWVTDALGDDHDVCQFNIQCTIW